MPLASLAMTLGLTGSVGTLLAIGIHNRSLQRNYPTIAPAQSDNTGSPLFDCAGLKRRHQSIRVEVRLRARHDSDQRAEDGATVNELLTGKCDGYIREHSRGSCWAESSNRCRNRRGESDLARRLCGRRSTACHSQSGIGDYLLYLYGILVRGSKSREIVIETIDWFSRAIGKDEHPRFLLPTVVPEHTARQLRNIIPFGGGKPAVLAVDDHQAIVAAPRNDQRSTKAPIELGRDTSD